MVDPLPSFARDHTILSVVVGSRAYGLETADSDVDRRGVFVAPAELFWRLDKPPAHVGDPDEERFWWEIERFCGLALAANPTVLECLWSPVVEEITPVGEELLALRDAFLSREAHRTFLKYADTQLKRADRSVPNWKQVMHMLRLLISGRHLALTGEPLVRVDASRERLLAVRRGELSWAEVDDWRASLVRELDDAAGRSRLPARPDRDRVEEFLISVRRRSLAGRRAMRGRKGQGWPMTGLPGWLPEEANAQPYPIVFATVSGAHLYGFPSEDSDVDLRGVHALQISEIAGLRLGEETLDRSWTRDGIEVDLVTHDVAKFCRLMLRRNGYVLEQLLSPLVVITSSLHEELVGLAPSCVTRNHAHHYLGFARTHWGFFEKTGSLKPLLYTFRVLLTGVHLMRTGDVVADLRELPDGPPYLAELIEAKRTAEHGALPSGFDRVRLARDVSALTATLEEARDESRLPERPDAFDALHDLVLRARGS